MNKAILRWFNIEKGEETTVLLFILQSIFIGVFYGAFDVGAHALFLDIYHPEDIPRAYVVSGVAGIILTSLYTMFQSRIKFSRFASFNLLFVVLVTLFLRLGLGAVPKNILVFIVLVMMGPLNILAMLGFWGSVGRIFTLRQGKRLFGLIDTGQIVGIIVGTYTIPILLSLGYDTWDLLIIAAGSILVAMLFQLVIAGRYSSGTNVPIVAVSKKRDNFFSLLKSRYVILMSVFVVLSVITAFFIQYSFLAVSKINYPDTISLAQFLGAFTGTVMVFSVMIKTFVYSKFLKTYGLKITLALSPLLLLLFTGGAAFIGSFFGYTKEAAAFTFFFLLIALGRLFSKTLHDSFEVPVFKLLYQSLDINIRYNVQARIDGTVNEIAALTSGLILMGLTSLSFFRLIDFSFVLIAVVLVWIYIAFKLYKAYKLSLSHSLEDYRKRNLLTNGKETISDIKQVMNKIFSEEFNITHYYVLGISEMISPASYEQNLPGFLEHPDSRLRSWTIDKINQRELIGTKPVLQEIYKTETEKELIDKMAPLVNRFEAIDFQSFNENTIEQALKSRDPESRKLFVNIIVENGDPAFYSWLRFLVRDPDTQVRKLAILAVGKTRYTEMMFLVAEYLGTDDFYSEAFDALLLFGDVVCDHLEQMFYRTGIDEKTCLRIIRLWGKIHSVKSTGYLVKKIDYYNKKLAWHAVRVLKENHFHAKGNLVQKILDLVRTQCGIIGRNMIVVLGFKDNGELAGLKNQIEIEQQDHMNHLFDLLSLVYDTESVAHVKENLQTGTSESIGFAMELLDIFIHDEIKPYLLPLLDDMPLADKIKELQKEYPLVKVPFEKLPEEILNRDIYQISPVSKAICIRNFGEVFTAKATGSLIAHLFNPLRLIAETAACKLHEIDFEFYQQCASRLPDETQQQNSRAIDYYQSSSYHLLLDRVMFLIEQSYFSNLNSYDIVWVAEQVKVHLLKPGETFGSGYNQDMIALLMVVKGNGRIVTEKEEIIRIQENDIFDLRVVEGWKDCECNFIADESTVLYVLNYAALNELVFDYPETGNILIKLAESLKRNNIMIK
ncbi:MAG: hypothetical protein ACOC3S_02025 [Bacteroidota bacterium]